MFQRIKKTPTILQMEAVECGSVALAIILAYYKRWIPLDVLRSDCGISRDGSRADNLFKAAKKHGMDVEAYSIELDALDEFDLPAIIHWEFNHFDSVLNDALFSLSIPTILFFEFSPSVHRFLKCGRICRFFTSRYSTKIFR